MTKLKIIFQDKAILKRIIITLGLILLFRLGTLVPMPGATVTPGSSLGSGGQFLEVLNLLGGGGLSTFSLFALGVTPYITASIIIQLLSSDVVPFLVKLNKQGEKGRIKIEKITRILAIILAAIQAVAIVLALTNSGYIDTSAFNYDQWVNVLMFTIILIAGSMIAIWIADQITMKGIGNGTSMIIFVGIVGVIPTQIQGAWDILVGSEQAGLLTGLMNFALFGLLALIMIIVISFLETSQRKLPIQQIGQGLQLEKQKQTYLPIKINPAGVVPVIFASAIMALPPTVAQFFSESSYGRNWVIANFDLTSAFGLSMYAIMVFAFTMFYSHININSEQIADNFKKSSTFIVGVKPGEQTRKYIAKTVTALSIMGGLVLTVIAISPYVLSNLGIDQSIAAGGTGMIIMVSVAIDTWDQLKARIVASTTKSTQHKKISENQNGLFGRRTDKKIKDVEKKPKKGTPSTETILFD